MPVLVNIAYMPPVEYFAAMASEFTLPLTRQGKFIGQASPAVVYLEAHENYQKQSWRNRCSFLAASGRSTLSFPVVHENGTHTLPIKQVKVDWSTSWTRQHERAIISAYSTSAYFEYYRDELFSIFGSRPETLWELDLALMNFFLRKIGLSVELRETEDFLVPDGICSSGVWKGLPCISSLDAVDLRGVIHPKKENDILRRLDMEKPYFQVFSGKYGFVKKLSVMDLLFNEGPESITGIYSSRQPVSAF